MSSGKALSGLRFVPKLTLLPCRPIILFAFLIGVNAGLTLSSALVSRTRRLRHYRWVMLIEGCLCRKPAFPPSLLDSAKTLRSLPNAALPCSP